ncbi:LysR family transcriptional regulator [Cellulomonas sp. PhB143]|uniref:LysR family transcriptional regulator n=1 Tax=Cellulomonas sp. PhB143 TaxID=2485186 RepID=UPI001F479114|nr:LysR family transcriptional regulator [Cellulomonas sp. PhB143]
MRYFVTLADELHFGRAASRLYVSQPALSKQIRKLENDVGGLLLVRDSRHVALTPRGERFLGDARRLLAIAERMRRTPDPRSVRIAHIFELETCRLVADAFAGDFEDVRLVEHSMDSARQLDALLAEQLDVAILRLTPQMLAEHPTGWRRQLLRLEPMLLVGRAGDLPRDSASLHERPVEVFADAAGSRMFNVHGEYLAAFERQTLVPLRWLGNPGTFQHCLAGVSRGREPAFTLEFESYAHRYAEAGIPVHRPAELQPVYPWWVAWRAENPSRATTDFVETAVQTSATRGWLQPDAVGRAPMWLPSDDPALVEQRSA